MTIPGCKAIHPRLGPWLVLGVVVPMLGLSSCGAAVRGAASGARSFHDSHLFYAGRHGPLTEKEQLWAKVAWHYFQNNTSAETGLVNGVDGEARASMSDVADYLAALLAARRFKLIDEKEFDERLSRILETLNVLPLAGGGLPNLYYDTKSRALLDLNGDVTPGLWSATDIGRLLLWLRITRQQKPELAEYIDRIVLRWNVCEALDERGNLQGGMVTATHGVVRLNYTRLGYQQYAAAGFESWGFNARGGLAFEPAAPVKLLDVTLLHDGRDERITGMLTPILSMPYLQAGMEFDWDPPGAVSRSLGRAFRSQAEELAQEVYRVQKTRYQKDKIITARTDHRMNGAPYHVVDAIFVKGYPWNTVSDAGDPLPQEAAVATQAVFPMRALWKTPYSDVLTKSIDNLYVPDKGWYEGRFGRTGGISRPISLRTNAMVLEALLYQVEGKLYRPEPRLGLFELWVRDPYKPRHDCLVRDGQK